MTMMMMMFVEFFFKKKRKKTKQKSNLDYNLEQIDQKISVKQFENNNFFIICFSMMEKLHCSDLEKKLDE